MQTILRSTLVILVLAAVAVVRVDTARAQTGSYVIAVLPFTSADDGKSKDLQKHMITDLNELGQYTLIEVRDVNDAVQDGGFRPGAAIPDAKALEIARGLEAKIVATGVLENRGGTWVAKGVFVDVPTRTVQELPEVSGRNPEEVAAKLIEAFNSRNQANKHVAFGIDYVRSENWDRAITNLQKALEFEAQLAPAHYWLGQAHIRKGDAPTGLRELQEAVRLDPAYITAYHQIGQAYLEQGDTTAARNYFEQLVQQRADDCDIQIAYGYVMANQLGEPEKGLAAFERAKQLCPDNPKAYQYLAYALPEDRVDDKIENFKKYLELSEGKATDPEALQYLFGLYFVGERYQEAKEAIDQVLAADPENAQLQLYAGVVAGKLGQNDEAIQHFTKAVEINPELTDAYLYRGLAYQAKGDMTNYALDLEKAGRGQSSEILASLALGEASRHLRSGRAGAALEALNRAQALGADRCAISYYRGDAYYKMGSGLQGEDKSLGSNQRSIDMFRTAINHLQSACGTYSQYSNPLIGNANQYIERGEAIVRKQSRSGAR